MFSSLHARLQPHNYFSLVKVSVVKEIIYRGTYICYLRKTTNLSDDLINSDLTWVDLCYLSKRKRPK